MALAIEEVSTITAKGQTTVPKSIRRALGVDYGGRIAFRVNEGAVTVVRAEEEDDPAIDAFLQFLGEDLKRRPEAVRVISSDMAARIVALTDKVACDPDEVIDGPVAL